MSENVETCTSPERLSKFLGMVADIFIYLTLHTTAVECKIWHPSID